jgi:molecular chaperone GrpE
MDKVDVKAAAENSEAVQEEQQKTADENRQESSDDSLQKKDFEIAQLKDALLRARADFDNFRKRCIKNEEINKKLAVKDMALDIININDNIIRASDAAVHIQEGDTLDHAHKAFVDGVMLISKSIEQSLEKHGVEQIDALNSPFNPVFHEAVEFDVSDDIKEDTVTKVYQKGFKIDAMVIRTAKVKVSKSGKKPEASADKIEEPGKAPADNNENE